MTSGNILLRLTATGGACRSYTRTCIVSHGRRRGRRYSSTFHFFSVAL